MRLTDEHEARIRSVANGLGSYHLQALLAEVDALRAERDAAVRATNEVASSWQQIANEERRRAEAAETERDQACNRERVASIAAAARTAERDLAEARIAAALAITPDEGAGTYYDEDEGFANGWNDALAEVRAALAAPVPVPTPEPDWNEACPCGHARKRHASPQGCHIIGCPCEWPDTEPTPAAAAPTPPPDHLGWCARCGDTKYVDDPTDPDSGAQMPCPSCSAPPPPEPCATCGGTRYICGAGGGSCDLSICKNDRRPCLSCSVPNPGDET